MTDENLKEQNDTAARTMKNMDELLKGTIATNMPEPPFTNDLKRQSQYVAASLHRCRRCGDHTPFLLPSPPLVTLCGACEAALKGKEDVIWFADMVARIQHGEPEKETEDG